MYTTVDGSEIRQAPVEVGRTGSSSRIIFRVLHIPGGGGFLPSTVTGDHYIPDFSPCMHFLIGKLFKIYNLHRFAASKKIP